MRQKILNKFNSLSAGQKRVVSIIGIGAVVTTIGVAGYFSSLRNQSATKTSSRKADVNVVQMDNKLLEQSRLLDAQKEAHVAKEALEDAKKKEEETAKALAAGLLPPGAEKPSKVPETGLKPVTNSDKLAAAMLPPVPKNTHPRAMPELPPPPKVNPGIPPAPGSAGMPAAGPGTESEIGGISLVSNSQKAIESKEDKKKDEKRTVYLPISYMEATLLSGLDAPTSSDAKGNPVPVLIRVKTPAVLPNEVKANLRGCFVIADGKGNLGTERAELIVTNLSCIDRKGQAVIDQQLVGYVVDADGKAGLRGRVVTKMGAVIARSMVAGVFGGVGDALKSSSTTSTVSALGSLSTIKPESIGMAALGGGLSNAFTEIQKFYMEMARSMMPVIEIGAARPVTLVITKGTNLEIKKIKGGGRS